MEFMIGWFWAINLILTGGFIYIVYLTAYVWKFKSKALNVIAIILGILLIVSPLKLKPTTDSMNTVQTHQIAATKVLPPLVKDDSFKQASESVDGITEEDLK